MTFWNTNPEPFRKNRWNLVFGNLKSGSDSLVYALKKCDKPSYKTTDITHKFGNYNFYYPGRVEWNTINVTFAAVPTIDTVLLTILKTAGYHGPSSEAKALQAASKVSFNTAVGPITIQQLDHTGSKIEWWDLVSPFFTNIKFGELSYESEEIIDIECTIRFDSATYNKTAN